MVKIFTDKKSFQAVVDDINKELNIHELDTSYNIVYLNALGISYTANSEDANDKGFSFMTVAGILVGSLILLAAGLVIYNILKISVSKRIKGYGTLRAIGGEKGQLYQIIVIEVILLCLMGIPIGMLLGFLSARGILEAATGLVSPELFLVQDASELKTLIAEKGIAFVKSRRAELNVVQMVENMRDQAMPNGVIINDAYCDRSMTRDYDREGLNAFFATLKEEDFEVVVVRSLNEITDDIFDLEEFVKTITDMGIWLYSLEVGPVPITASHAEDFGC